MLEELEGSTLEESMQCFKNYCWPFKHSSSVELMDSHVHQLNKKQDFFKGLLYGEALNFSDVGQRINVQIILDRYFENFVNNNSELCFRQLVDNLGLECCKDVNSWLNGVNKNIEKIYLFLQKNIIVWCNQSILLSEKRLNLNKKTRSLEHDNTLILRFSSTLQEGDSDFAKQSKSLKEKSKTIVDEKEKINHEIHGIERNINDLIFMIFDTLALLAIINQKKQFSFYQNVVAPKINDQDLPLLNLCFSKVYRSFFNKFFDFYTPIKYCFDKSKSLKILTKKSDAVEDSLEKYLCKEDVCEEVDITSMIVDLNLPSNVIYSNLGRLFLITNDQIEDMFDLALGDMRNRLNDTLFQNSHQLNSDVCFCLNNFFKIFFMEDKVVNDVIFNLLYQAKKLKYGGKYVLKLRYGEENALFDVELDFREVLKFFKTYPKSEVSSMQRTEYADYLILPIDSLLSFFSFMHHHGLLPKDKAALDASPRPLFTPNR